MKSCILLMFNSLMHNYNLIFVVEEVIIIHWNNKGIIND